MTSSLISFLPSIGIDYSFVSIFIRLVHKYIDGCCQFVSVGDCWFVYSCKVAGEQGFLMDY